MNIFDNNLPENGYRVNGQICCNRFCVFCYNLGVPLLVLSTPPPPPPSLGRIQYPKFICVRSIWMGTHTSIKTNILYCMSEYIYQCIA